MNAATIKIMKAKTNRMVLKISMNSLKLSACSSTRSSTVTTSKPVGRIFSIFSLTPVWSNPASTLSVMSSNPIPALKNSTDASVLMATIFAPTTAFSSGSAKLNVPTSRTSRRPEGVCKAYVCPTTKSSSNAVSVSTANSV